METARYEKNIDSHNGCGLKISDPFCSPVRWFLFDIEMKTIYLHFDDSWWLGGGALRHDAT